MVAPLSPDVFPDLLFLSLLLSCSCITAPRSTHNTHNTRENMINYDRATLDGTPDACLIYIAKRVAKTIIAQSNTFEDHVAEFAACS